MSRADSLDKVIAKLKDGNVQVASQTPYERGQRERRRGQTREALKARRKKIKVDPWGAGKLRLPKGTGE
tara:strand:- start:250 stop:456 length:207 start_codon:yes stop_codon:yes gene_type:complete